MDGVKKQLAATWTLVNTESDGVERTTWKFTDEAGKAWTAETTIKPDATTKGKFVMSLHMQKVS
jgi:hypothetical protein